MLKKIIIFWIWLLFPLSVWAMTPLTDLDLGNVNNPLSLSINPVQVTDINNETMDWDDGDMSRFLLFAIKRWSKARLQLPDSAVEAAEESEAFNRFSFFYVSSGNRNDDKSIKNFLIDPITLKDAYTIGSSADDHNQYTISDKPTRSFVYPTGLSTSSNSPVIVHVKPDGNTLLRTYYTNDTNSTIRPNSWVDIKTR